MRSWGLDMKRWWMGDLVVMVSGVEGTLSARW
jgi:hypothetical protein